MRGGDTKDSDLLVAELERKLRELAAEHEQLRAAHKEVIESLSWRLSDPIRRLSSKSPPALKAALRRSIFRVLDLVGLAKMVLARCKRKVMVGRLSRLFSKSAAGGVSRAFDENRSREWIRKISQSRGATFLAETRPLVSVVLPTRDRARSVIPAIQSIIAQTYDNWELIVVDDGSTDDTIELIQRSFTEPRLKLLQSGGKGVCEARNCGLRAATGDFIAYLDSDNSWTPRYLELMLMSLLDSGADCCYAVLKCINTKPEFYRQQSFDYDALKLQNYIDLNIFMHTRAVLSQVGLFDSSLKRMVDWDLILRVAKRKNIACADFVGALYDAGPAADRITNAESASYQNVVRNRHWIDWSEVQRAVAERDPTLTSVIICVYDQPELTEACLSSLFRDNSAGRFEVILVDNGSKSATAYLLTKWARSHGNVKVVTNPVNFDFALGNNIGFAASRGRSVIFLNNDTEVTHGWAGELIGRLQDGDDVGAVGPRLLYGNNTVQCAGLAFSKRSLIPYHIYRGQPGTADCVNKERYFQALTGACLAMRAEDFAQLKGFNPLYINGCEDLDLCFRIRHELGKKLLYRPTSLVYHHEGSSAGRGKHILFNRKCFVEAWGDRVIADDVGFYRQDGFTVQEYAKPGSEPDGNTAVYIPTISSDAPKLGDLDPVRELQIGVVSIWYVRGISLLAKQCCEALDEGAYRTHVLARWESDRFSNSGVVEHPHVTNGGDDPSPEETVRWARMNALDVIIFMEVHPNDWKRVRALRAAGFKVLALEMMDILRKEHVDRYGGLDGFLCIAQYSYDFFRAKFPHIPAILIPWGTPEAPNQNVGRVSTQNDGVINFVHVAGWGGINNRKNTDGLIRAFAKAAPSNARLHLYTQAPLAKYGQECEELVKKSECFVVHEGTIPDISKAYEGKDMLLWPSKREGLGLPILEALAAGLPVVISDGYMMKQWIVPGEHGLMVDAKPQHGIAWLPEMQVDEDAFAQVVRDICQNPSCIKRFREAVLRDRDVWVWSWQPAVLRGQLLRFIRSPQNIAEPDSYLPEFIQNFEHRRNASGSFVIGGSGESYEMQSV